MKRARGTHLRRLPPAPAAHTATIGEATYQWELRHGWDAARGASSRGVSVSVWARRHQTRELILELPASWFGRETPTPAELLEAVERAIPAALAAGWDPESRGRPRRVVPGDED